MKYVYVLTSTPSDLYYEQALMSAYSLRKHNSDAEVIVLTDNKTYSGLTEENKRLALKEYVSQIISVDFEDSVPNIDRSRLIKTSIPQYVSGSFLYIDCDTIICDDLSSIENVSAVTGGVLDGHCMLNEHIHKKYFLRRDKKLGFSGTKSLGANINGGLVLAKADTQEQKEETEELFRQWNEIWKYSAYVKHDRHDQSALNEANFRTGLKMKFLDGIWNCQPSHGGLAFLKNAKIIHYYSSEFSGKNYIPYYKLADKKLQERIKECGSIPDDIKEMIDDPKFQFNPVHLINDSRIVSIMQSPLTFTVSDIKAHCPALFNLLEAVCSGIRGLGKKLKGKK
ncbi:MAG: glycosyl transferase [Treponema sp.]|nr:glycosyl transferase [Treponema sp.]